MLPAGALAIPALRRSLALGAKAFQLWEVLSAASASKDQVGLLGEKQVGSFCSETAVLCGRFLPRITLEALKEHVREGGQLLFPFEVPKYDENLSCFPWDFNSKADEVVGDGGSFLRYRLGAGKVWTPLKPWSVDPDLFLSLQTVMEGMSYERPV